VKGSLPFLWSNQKFAGIFSCWTVPAEVISGGPGFHREGCKVPSHFSERRGYLIVSRFVGITWTNWRSLDLYKIRLETAQEKPVIRPARYSALPDDETATGTTRFWW